MKTYDAIVIGAGIAGASAAYCLTRKGVDVCIVERDSPAAHASGFAFGMVSAPFSVSDGAPAVERLLSRSVDLHHRLPEELRDACGAQYHNLIKAGVRLALDAQEAAHLKQVGVSGFRAASSNIKGRSDLRWLEYGGLSHIEARISEDVIGGLYMGGQLEVAPDGLTKSLVQAAVASGRAEELTGEVSAIEIENGKIAGVRVSGEVLSAGHVLLAAGPWCPIVLRNSQGADDVRLPITPLKGQIVRFDIGDEIPMPVSIWWGSDYAASKPDGLLYAGTTEEESGFDSTPSAAAQNEIRASATSVLPFLKDASVAHQTACLRPIAPDRLPVVGTVDGIEGLVIATGGGRSGIELGPGIGELACEVVTGENEALIRSYSELSPSRFG